MTSCYFVHLVTAYHTSFVGLSCSAKSVVKETFFPWSAGFLFRVNAGSCVMAILAELRPAEIT